MAKSININEFLFSRTRAEKKLETIKQMSDEEIRKATSETILRIYKECRSKDCDGKPNDRFWIASNRRVGNNWNSTIEFIYENNGKACLCLYVQNSSTDSSTCESYDTFNRYNRYEGYCHNLNKHFTYNADDIARTIRCILMEYVYWKYIEKDERERKEKVNKLLHYKIFNPVLNKFYEDWGCKYQGGYPGAPHDRIDRYHRAEKAVKSYVEVHADELMGKSVDELQGIYKDIFRMTE